MANLLRGERQFDDTGDLAGYRVYYTVKHASLPQYQIRILFIPAADTNGLTLEQIRALAQTRADTDTNLVADDGTLFNAAAEAKDDFGALPNWATWTGAEAAEALRVGILAGMTKAEARAAIDAQFAGVTNLAQLGAATMAILKTLADAVIDGRDLGHQNEAKALMWLRDVAIR